MRQLCPSSMAPGQMMSSCLLAFSPAEVSGLKPPPPPSPSLLGSTSLHPLPLTPSLCKAQTHLVTTSGDSGSPSFCQELGRESRCWNQDQGIQGKTWRQDRPRHCLPSTSLDSRFLLHPLIPASRPTIGKPRRCFLFPGSNLGTEKFSDWFFP